MLYIIKTGAYILVKFCFSKKGADVEKSFFLRLRVTHWVKALHSAGFPK